MQLGIRAANRLAFSSFYERHLDRLVYNLALTAQHLASMTKEHILSEIRRTAAANGGVSLGRLRFFQATGIREADWKGKHWPRWSDAVREAGIEPNKQTTAFSEEALIEKLISVMRAFGRFPVVAEMRITRRADPSLANDKTYRRFGSKRELAARIKKYCETRSGYEDVLPMCEAVVGSRGAQDDAGTASQEFGFVYLMRSGRFYKIGRSNSAGRREYELAIQLPEAAKTIHSIRTDDPAGIEAYWHRRFADKRKNGEWFELGAQDVTAFRRRKFM